MRKSLSLNLLATLLLIGSPAFSQKGIKGLVNAEKAFAACTEMHTIRDGFLQFMDSAGIIFRQGNAVNALENFQQQKPGPAILSWSPSFAVISSSGDMGVTMGPYELRTKSLQDTPVARGSFSSIWKMNKEGIWKNMADLGVSYTSPQQLATKIKEITLTGEKNDATTAAVIFALDQKLNDAINEKKSKSLLSFLSPDSRLNIEGQTPITGIESINTVLQASPNTLTLHFEGGTISSAKDFAYTYGTVTNGVKKDNYLRAWIWHDKKWQVILQTIRW